LLRCQASASPPPPGGHILQMKDRRPRPAPQRTSPRRTAQAAAAARSGTCSFWRMR
jgi:hypothetical protein